MHPDPPRLTAAEVALRLGVKVPTVYAYVSRGYLHSERTPDGRSSTFDAAQVDRVARRGRPRRSSRQPVLEIEIVTSLTDVSGGHLRFRGYDAVELARSATFESVAELLVVDEFEGRFRTWPAGHVQPVAEGTNLDRLRIATAAAAAGDAFGADLSPDAVVATARRLIPAIVGALPIRSRRGSPRLRLIAADGSRVTVSGTIAEQLAPRLGRRPVDTALVSMVNGALCLLADHELAVSTLAARVAASAHADPYGVVSAGLGPFSGSLHGTASRHVRTLLDRADTGGVSAAVNEALQVHRHVPGFGHPLYPQGDPRCTELLRLLREHWSGKDGMDTVETVLSMAVDRTQVHPNVDFALGAIGHVGELGHDAGDAVFGVARTAGWLAHAVEEYGERPLRFRPRARYAGSEPRSL